VAPSFLKARQTKYATYAAVYIIVIFAVVAVANVLADRYNKTYDSTANKRYSLSDQTIKIIKGLKQDVTLTYFDQGKGFDNARDTLSLYQNLSSKVHVKYVDVDKDPEAARAAGVRSYGTTAVEIGGKTELANSLSEEDILGAFIRDLKNNTRTVCFVTGSGEHQIDDTTQAGYSRFKDLLTKEQYAAKSINLLEKAEVPGDCTVVVVGGPVDDYQQPEVDGIAQFVEAGGRAMFLLDPPLKIGKPQIADNDGLVALLTSWGVTPEKNMILDLNPVGQIAGVGPQVALIMNYESHPIVNDLKGTATGFPLARALDIKTSDKTTVAKLFETSDTSLATTNLSSRSVNPNDAKNQHGPMTIAVAGTYNTGSSNTQGRFVVVGSSEWIANSFIAFNGNSDLALDAMNWLSSDEDLISIRPKEQEDRPLTMTTSQLNWVIISTQLLLPLLIVVLGLTAWWRHR
jgi:ABC-type uncharacterized transport system involved in gliding motility auxiliary subunit